jgi:hypothetical protein
MIRGLLYAKKDHERLLEVFVDDNYELIEITKYFEDLNVDGD